MKFAYGLQAVSCHWYKKLWMLRLMTFSLNSLRMQYVQNLSTNRLQERDEQEGSELPSDDCSAKVSQIVIVLILVD